MSGEVSSSTAVTTSSSSGVEQISVCTSTSCQNGGACSNGQCICLSRFRGPECETANEFVKIIQFFSIQLVDDAAVEEFKNSYGRDLAYMLGVTGDHIVFDYVGSPRATTNSAIDKIVKMITFAATTGTEVEFDIIVFANDNFTAAGKLGELQAQINDPNSWFHRSSQYSGSLLSTAQVCSDGSVRPSCDTNQSGTTTLSSTGSSPLNSGANVGEDKNLLIGMWVGISLGIVTTLCVSGYCIKKKCFRKQPKIRDLFLP